MAKSDREKQIQELEDAIANEATSLTHMVAAGHAGRAYLAEPSNEKLHAYLRKRMDLNTWAEGVYRARLAALIDELESLRGPQPEADDAEI